MSAYEFNQIVGVLKDILASQLRMEKIMADTSVDIQTLVTTVTKITADVAAALALLKNNLSPADQATLEAQITALQNVDATLQAAVPPAPPAPPAGP